MSELLKEPIVGNEERRVEYLTLMKIDCLILEELLDNLSYKRAS